MPFNLFNLFSGMRTTQDKKSACSYFYYHNKNNENVEYVVYFIWDSSDIDENMNENMNQKIIDAVMLLFQNDSTIKLTNTDSILHDEYIRHTPISIITNENMHHSNVILNDTVEILSNLNKKHNIYEWGSKYSMETPWSSNMKSVLGRSGFSQLLRIEKFTRCKNPSIFFKNYDPIIHQSNHFLRSLYNDIQQPKTNKNNNKMDGFQQININELQKYNQEWNLALDEDDIEWYQQLFKKLGRNPTKAEIFDLAQSNSEHSRHWVFNSHLEIMDDVIVDTDGQPTTLFKMVKKPVKSCENNSRVAFADNSSCIKGSQVITQQYNNTPEIGYKSRIQNPTLTAETHNFPTGIAPFEGAATGVGGRIRDTLAIGRGGDMVASMAGYCVGNLQLDNMYNPWENYEYDYNKLIKTPKDILINASNGSSDYGNKVGEPIIGGFVRTVGQQVGKTPYHFFKPIMFSAGIGTVYEENTDKLPVNESSVGWLVCQVGGPAFPIGLGGGSSSSMNQTSETDQFQNAVQRGNPEMATRVVNFIRTIISLTNNPIKSIHDQGAGGPANVIKEIMFPYGGVVDTGKIPRGDKNMSFLQVWCSEFQEQMTFLIHPDDWELVRQVGERENVSVYSVGQIEDCHDIKVIDTLINDSNSSNGCNGDNSSHNRFIDTPVGLDLPVNDILSDIPTKKMKLKQTVISQFDESIITHEDLFDINFFKESVNRLLQLPSISCKKYLTNKVDRSVSGLIAQQQCVGPKHIPLSDYSLIADSYYQNNVSENRLNLNLNSELVPRLTSGVASSIGENSIIGFNGNYSAFSRKIVAEMLTNLVGCCISDLKDVKCSANWMWAPKESEEEAFKLYQAMDALSELCCQLGIAIDGGKDSVSMKSTAIKKDTGEVESVLSPPTLVLTSYAPVPDITKKLTPDFKKPNSHIIYIPFIETMENSVTKNLSNLNGSCFQQVFNQLGINNPIFGGCVDITNPKYFIKCFNTIQYFIKNENILSCHDISDGGLIITLLEMAFASNIGINSNISIFDIQSPIYFWMNESPGVVIEVEENHLSLVTSFLSNMSINHFLIGNTTYEDTVSIKFNGNILINSFMSELRYIWEKTNFILEKEQSNVDTVNQEIEYSFKTNDLLYKLNPYIIETLSNSLLFNPLENIEIGNNIIQPKVAILREIGSNGHREMIAAFTHAGFKVDCITTQDLLNGIKLDKYRGLVLVGGFSYGDVPSAGVGWVSTLVNNETIYQELTQFREREDTFCLGICNGCQVLSHLGWVEGNYNIIHNKSNRFESRWANIRIAKNNSIFMSNMEDSVFGIWVAHGEGLFDFQMEQDTLNNDMLFNNQITSQYVDVDNMPTYHYPENPNGSQYATASLSSLDGRVLMMMPHPERSFLDWQIPYANQDYQNMKKNNNFVYTPWYILFKNAYNWCLSQ